MSGIVIYSDTQIFKIVTRPKSIRDFPLGSIVFTLESEVKVFGMVCYALSSGDEMMVHLADRALSNGSRSIDTFKDQINNRAKVRTEITCVVIGCQTANNRLSSLPPVPPVLLSYAEHCDLENDEQLKSILSNGSYINTLMQTMGGRIPIPMPQLMGQHIAWLNNAGIDIRPHLESIFAKTAQNAELAFLFADILNEQLSDDSL